MCDRAWLLLMIVLSVTGPDYWWWRHFVWQGLISDDDFTVCDRAWYPMMIVLYVTGPAYWWWLYCVWHGLITDDDCIMCDRACLLMMIVLCVTGPDHWWLLYCVWQGLITDDNCTMCDRAWLLMIICTVCVTGPRANPVHSPHPPWPSGPHREDTGGGWPVLCSYRHRLLPGQIMCSCSG